ncbi:hypothetical protein MSAN_01092600 [Mycena sanguinolenta]|uniref:Uncharacterized protein n=1 Tax=Mycena sanguinolenta TaxID=230812 RepID=A0A8H6YUX6_9AGAR|nr:hypothetical protein MSAN_01092600 [Mycena sanguinolenta]
MPPSTPPTQAALHGSDAALHDLGFTRYAAMYVPVSGEYCICGRMNTAYACPDGFFTASDAAFDPDERLRPNGVAGRLNVLQRCSVVGCPTLTERGMCGIPAPPSHAVTRHPTRERHLFARCMNLAHSPA